jgi:hypothetical protein
MGTKDFPRELTGHSMELMTHFHLVLRLRIVELREACKLDFSILSSWRRLE